MIVEFALSAALSTSSLTGGASETAKYVEGKRRESREHVEQSHTFGSALDRARQELRDLADDCAEPNWDGYGALPVNWGAYLNAYRFLENVPLGTEVPSPGVDPDGELTFEWYRGPRRTLSISVGEEGDLNYAALIGSTRAYGQEPFLGDVPRVIAELISRVTTGS
jgi:hypothetical protein